MVKILYTLAALACIGGEFLRFQFSGGIAVRMLDVVTVAMAAYVVFSVLREKRLHNSPLLRPLVLFLAICILSLLINLPRWGIERTLIASLYLVRYIAYTSYFFVAMDLNNQGVKFVRQLLLIISVSLVGIGYLQFFFYNNLANLYYLGWDIHLYRMFSTFFDPNFMGVFYVLILFYLFSLFLMKNISQQRKILIFVLGIATLFAVILTYSRTALVMLFVSLIVSSFFAFNKKMVLGLVTVLIVGVLLLSNSGVEGLNPFRTASTRERILSMQNALTIIQRNVFFGVGFNAYRYAQNEYGIRTSEQWESSHADAGTDNSFLFVFATTGIFGLLSYLYLIRTKYLMATQSLTNQDHVGKVVVLSLCGLVVSSFFLNTLFYPYILFWFWSLFGLTRDTSR